MVELQEKLYFVLSHLFRFHIFTSYKAIKPLSTYHILLISPITGLVLFTLYFAYAIKINLFDFSNYEFLPSDYVAVFLDLYNPQWQESQFKWYVPQALYTKKLVSFRKRAYNLIFDLSSNVTYPAVSLSGTVLHL